MFEENEELKRVVENNLKNELEDEEASNTQENKEDKKLIPQIINEKKKKETTKVNDAARKEENNSKKKYQIYPIEVKKAIINEVSKNRIYNIELKKAKKCKDIQEVAKIYGIKLKTLQRWVKIGPEKKRGK